MQGPVLASQLSPEQSQTAAISFGPDGSNVVYSSPMLQDKLLVYDYQRGMAVRYISMQQPMSVLCGPLSDDSIAFADASGTVGTLDIKTNRSSLVQGSCLHKQCRNHSVTSLAPLASARDVSVSRQCLCLSLILAMPRRLHIVL